MSTGPAAAMRRAILLAASTRPHPNPRVGAVVVDREGTVLTEGAHTGPGSPHAERLALDALGGPPPGDATLVVTLEPCDHHGLTPPCTETILAAGIRRVVVGALDPDPRVSGTGVQRLRAAGVEVEEGVLADEVEEADAAYFHHRRHGRAQMTLKRAMTLDGQTAARDSTSQWITGPEARDDAHLLRAEADAVLVGAGTVRSDDPLLTVRLPGYDGHQPTAVVMAGDGGLPSAARLWSRPDTLVVASHPIDAPAEVLAVDKGPEGWPDPDEVAVKLGERGLLAVLVEGGARISAALWRSGLVDRGVTYVGGLVAGGDGLSIFAGPWGSISDGRRVDIRDVARVGGDVRIDWRPARE